MGLPKADMSEAVDAAQRRMAAMLAGMGLIEADAALDDVRRLVWTFGFSGEAIDLADGGFLDNPKQREIVAILAGLPVALCEMAILAARANIWASSYRTPPMQPECILQVTGGGSILQ